MELLESSSSERDKRDEVQKKFTQQLSLTQKLITAEKNKIERKKTYEVFKTMLDNETVKK